MKLNPKRWIAIITASALVMTAAWFFSKPSPVRLTAKGQLQNNQPYAASCEMVPLSSFSPFSARGYMMCSLDLTIHGKARAVPANALEGITVHHPKQPLRVSEEGPVVILSMGAGENGHQVQWRYLNGFFAQRRVLNGKEVTIHDAEATLEAPTMVSNVSPEAPRRLGSPSLLSTPDEAPGKASQNGHE